MFFETELLFIQNLPHNNSVVLLPLIQIKSIIIIIIICSTPNSLKAVNSKLTLPILLHNWHAILKVTYVYRSCGCINAVQNDMLRFNKVLSKTLMLQQEKYNLYCYKWFNTQTMQLQ